MSFTCNKCYGEFAGQGISSGLFRGALCNVCIQTEAVEKSNERATRVNQRAERASRPALTEHERAVLLDKIESAKTYAGIVPGILFGLVMMFPAYLFQWHGKELIEGYGCWSAFAVSFVLVGGLARMFPGLCESNDD